jgi:SAM-dependent methyltransferase
MKKLHLGCGHDIKAGWVNHDLSPLPGVDIVHDLNRFPWPFQDAEFSEVWMKDVLEHLPDTIAVMEELYRITAPGAKVYIAVPYWNSFESITDPTHKRSFNELTFEFFDPTKRRCQNRPYYSKARFVIRRQGYFIKPFAPHLDLTRFFGPFYVFNPILKWPLAFLASFFNNVIIGLELYLERPLEKP